MKLSVCLVLMEINCNDERLVRVRGRGGVDKLHRGGIFNLV
jgi:hypothetical protein